MRRQWVIQGICNMEPIFSLVLIIIGSLLKSFEICLRKMFDQNLQWMMGMLIVLFFYLELWEDMFLSDEFLFD